MIAFGVKGGQAAGEAFINAVKLASNLANVGDSKTLVIHPASTTHAQMDAETMKLAGLTEDMIRFSVGIEDIEDIALYFLKKYSNKLSKNIQSINQVSLKILKEYSWPGDIKELENLIEREVFKSHSTTLEIDAQTLDSSQTIGAYKLQEMIGDGGMGEVWKAEHQLLARLAAIKLIKNINSPAYKLPKSRSPNDRGFAISSISFNKRLNGNIHFPKG